MNVELRSIEVFVIIQKNYHFASQVNSVRNKIKFSLVLKLKRLSLVVTVSGGRTGVKEELRTL